LSHYCRHEKLNKIITMIEIYNEFGTIGAPSIYEITKLIYENNSPTTESLFRIRPNRTNI